MNRLRIRPRWPLHGGRLPRMLLLLVVLLLGLPLATAHERAEDHVSVRMETDDEDPETARLHYHLQTTLEVQEDADGAYVRAALPDPFHTLDSFRSLHGDHTGTQEVVFDDDGARWAEFRWSEDAPPAGTRVDNMSLEGVYTFDPDDDLPVSWARLGDLAAHVSLPETHTITGADELVPRFHGAPEGRVEWGDIRLDADSMSFTIRSATVDEDPARAVPPFAYTHLFIVLGAGLLTGLLWWWGFHEDEERRKRL